MRGVIGTMSLALGALVTLSAGIFLAAAIGVEVRRSLGREYEIYSVYAFWGVLLVLVGIAVGLYRWQDAVLSWLEPLIGRGAPELLFCQMCGTVVRYDASYCPQCGGTRFGF